MKFVAAKSKLRSPGAQTGAVILLVDSCFRSTLPCLMRGAETEYNQVAYPSAIYPQTHPDRLATLGRLFGLAPEEVESARVLELGCGDGANLIAIAAALPNSHFTGIDFASDPVCRGGEVIKALDISNVDLQVGDITQADFGDARFD